MSKLRKAETYIESAWDNYNWGASKEAIADFDKAVKLDPENTEAYIGRGWAKRERRQYKDGRADFRKALEFDPELGEVDPELADRVRWLIKYPVAEGKSHVLESALNFQKIERDRSSEVYSKFTQFKHWYYFKEHDIFAPSKFIGYKEMTIAKYKVYGDGRETEEALKEWFEKLSEGSEEYRGLKRKLDNFATGLDKRIKKKACIHIEKNIEASKGDKTDAM